MGAPGDFAAALTAVRDVKGWLTDDQAHRLWDRARLVPAPGRVVEIGSYHGRSTIVLAVAVPDGVDLVAVDPHAGNDRGPRQIQGSAEDGQADHEQFHTNLDRAGVGRRVRYVRELSRDALDVVEGSVDLLYIDGAHRYVPARGDIESWGERVRDGGTMLIHDAFSAVGVTLAQLRLLFLGTEFRYVGRSGSMAEYRKGPVRGWGRARNAGRRLAQLPWFARNVLVKLALLAHATPIARLLGHHGTTFPY